MSCRLNALFALRHLVPQKLEMLSMLWWPIVRWELLTINTPTQGLKVHAMEHPVAGLEPLAEVEKTAYVIQGLINNKI